MFIFGFTFAAVCFVCCKTGVYAAYAAIIVSAAAAVIFFLIRPLRKVLEIPLTAAAILLSAVIFILFFNFSYKKAAAYDGTTAFTGKIISLPQKSYDVYRYEIETVSIGEEFVRIKLLYTSPDELYCDAFDCISVSDAKLYIPKTADGKESEAYKSRGIYLRAYSVDLPQVLFSYDKTPFYYILMFRQSIVNAVFERSSGDRAGIIIAMILGDTSYISAAAKDQFANSGAAHLLAVSGLNVSVWVSFLMAFLTLFGTGRKTASMLSLLFLAFFIVLTGFSASIIRAALMLAVVIVAPFFKRRADSLNSLGIAVFLIAAANPFSVLSVSLQLSVTATFGIITIGSYYCARFAKFITRIRVILLKRLISYAADIIIITVCAFVSTLPVTVAVFGRISLSAPATNLLVMGLSSLTMIFGGTGFVLSYSEILAPVANLWFAIAGTASGLILDCVNFFGSLTFSALPVDTVIYSFWLIATVILLICAAVILIRRKTRFPLEVTAALCVALFILGNSAAMMPSKINVKCTVLPVSGCPAVVLQSGRHYALICCPGDAGNFTYELTAHMPQMPSTSLDLLLMPYGTLGRESYADIIRDYSPKNIFADFNMYKDNSDILTDEVYIGDTAKFLLWGDVSVSYRNTEQANCVIIKINDKTVMISLSPENDIKEICEKLAVPNILICPDSLPQNMGAVIYDEIIVTGSLSQMRKDTYEKALIFTQDTHFTAYEGSICIFKRKGEK